MINCQRSWHLQSTPCCLSTFSFFPGTKNIKRLFHSTPPCQLHLLPFTPTQKFLLLFFSVAVLNSQPSVCLHHPAILRVPVTPGTIANHGCVFIQFFYTERKIATTTFRKSRTMKIFGTIYSCRLFSSESEASGKNKYSFGPGLSITWIWVPSPTWRNT